MEIKYFKNDLPDDFLKDLKDIAVDTETMGLRPYRDRLCLAQFSKGDGICYLVKFENFEKSNNIKNILSNNDVVKIFHYARFDVMMFYRYLSVLTQNIYCTKIASKLVRTYTNKHGLSDLCRDLLAIDLLKEQTCTDWGRDNLSDEQLKYAALDVFYLHKIKEILDTMLVRENRIKIANNCFEFLKTKVQLDLMIDENYDVFSHGA